MAIRHPDRVTALVLRVPLTYKPPTLADSSPPMPAWVEGAMLRMLGSDFLFWTAIHAPTLIISARDDRYGTYASAQYTAGQIPGARFIGFDHGGHTWVGHDDEVRAEIARLLLPSGRP